MSTATNITPENPLLLKVCGMRQRENIQAILALQPDLIGFIFYPKSARFVGDELTTALLNEVPATTQKVGVFVNATADTILTAVHTYNLNAVQLHGQESPDFCRQLRATGLVILKAFAVDENFDFKEIAPYEGSCDYYLFDTKGQAHGGNGVRFNWDILKEYTWQTPFFLSGGIDLEHAAQIKTLTLPLLRGIDINSRFEISPALKDSNKVQSFFRKIRRENEKAS